MDKVLGVQGSVIEQFAVEDLSLRDEVIKEARRQVELKLKAEMRRSSIIDTLYPDFHFPLRNNVKISEHAPNFNVFKPRLVCRRIFILPSGSSGKKFQIFHQFNTYSEFGDWTEIPKNLKFSKKSEILGFEKFRENYFNFFVL